MSCRYAFNHVQAVFVASDQRGRQQIVGAIPFNNGTERGSILGVESCGVVVEFHKAGIAGALLALTSDDETIADVKEFRNAKCRERALLRTTNVRSRVCNQLGCCEGLQIGTTMMMAFLWRAANALAVCIIIRILRDEAVHASLVSIIVFVQIRRNATIHAGGCVRCCRIATETFFINVWQRVA